MEDIIALLLIFGGGTLVALAMSPIGRAVAARISGQGAGANRDEVQGLRESHQALLAEVEEVRREVGELQERVDFAERLLARKRDEANLPPAHGTT